MFASVIFTTYNHPKWLEKTLWGFSAQSYRDFEIIVADDGSGEETRAVVESVRSEIDIPS
jgi:glycosyltransferase involved in cell wall biosynthesis